MSSSALVRRIPTCIIPLARATGVALTAAALLVAPPAAAVTLTASSNASVPADEPIPGANDFQQINVYGTAEANSLQTYDWMNAAVPLDTVFTGTSFAQATSTSLRVRTDLVVTDFDPAIAFEGAFVSAFARYNDTLVATFSGFSELWALPVFFVDGTASTTGAPRSTLSMTLNYFSGGVSDNVTLLRFDTLTDGSPLAFSGNAALAAPLPLLSGATASIDVRLNAETNLSLSGLAPGAHSGAVDFDNTASFLGLAVFEDQAMTTPYSGGDLSIVDGGGNGVAVVPEPSTAGLLSLSVVGLLCVRERLRRGLRSRPMRRGTL